MVLNTRALIEYRRGDYKEALKLCEPGALASIKANIPFDWIVAGMCYQQLSRYSESDQMRAKIVEWSNHQERLQAAGLKAGGSTDANPVPTKVLLDEFDQLRKTTKP